MNEQALKDKLRHIAREESRTINDVWKRLILERFLCRLSKSSYNEQLIFKGGLLLSYYISIERETRDIDLLADKITAQSNMIRNIINEICHIELSDGFSFLVNSIETLEHNHMDYEGFRVTIRTTFSGMQDVIKIDIGVGDAVSPQYLSIELCDHSGTPLFEEAVSLKVYPIETIFSEKLETIISRGAINTRMKDYHDLFLITQKKSSLDLEKLKTSISKTFENRRTTFLVLIEFTLDEYSKLQPLSLIHI